MFFRRQGLSVTLTAVLLRCRGGSETQGPSLMALALPSFESRFAFDLMELFSSGATTAISF